MSSYALPKWDKNRPIYFQLGMIMALSFANFAINYESTIPKFDYYETDDLSMSNVFQDVHLHSEQKNTTKPVIQKLNPIIARLVTVSEAVEDIDKINNPITTGTPNIEAPAILSPTIPSNNNELKEIAKDNKIWAIAENMPYLIGCNQNVSEDERRICTQKTLIAYIHSHLKYPSLAKDINIEGTVVLTFIIDKEGKMKDLTIARDIGGGCGHAAINALKGLSSWVAGKQNQQTVNVKYTIPIKFKLD